ncbi:MAG: glutathione synthetase [Actinomycetaceae bacterium]|nr:glutathione synthetase [Actinomycetaceae bacterium]
MVKKVTLVVSAESPQLDEDEATLPQALTDRGLEVDIRAWDDPSVDWNNAGICVLRSVPNYALDRDVFLKWAHSVPRLLNYSSILEWNTDKHYLQALEGHGMPIVPTTWLEPEQNLSKHQVHTRFPAHGDFVVKSAVSSGGRWIGRYTSTDPYQRMDAIEHAMELLGEGRSVMVQRYLKEVDRSGEISLVYFNGLISHTVRKNALLHPWARSTEEIHEQIATARQASELDWSWGEQIRHAVHSYIKENLGRDAQILYSRVDVVSDSKGGFYVMEVSMVDGSLYLKSTPDGVDNFADAIAQRAYW